MDLNEIISYLTRFADFPFSARRYLQHKVTLPQAEATIRSRLVQREKNFLDSAKRNIFDHPRSPYRFLFQQAQCGWDDLQALVLQHGMEGALQALRDAGVYVKFEEYKGRTPMVRDGHVRAVHTSDFNAPFVTSFFSGTSGGSSGAPRTDSYDFGFLADSAPVSMARMAAYDLLGAPVVVWRGILPDSSSMSHLLQQLRYGADERVRWYSHLGLRDAKGWKRYAFGTYYPLVWLRLLGSPIAFPRYVPMERADLIVEAILEDLRAEGRCVLVTQVSRALRVCLTARQLGVRLDGLTILGGGEPSTIGKVRPMQEVGARYFSNYASVDTGMLGYGCVTSDDPEDVHFRRDTFALITRPYTIPGVDVTVPAFHVTSLLPTAPRILLNVQLDDYGIIEERACGCPFGQYGYTTHLRAIRSYSKLVSEGVTLVGSEVLRLLEEVLPARFGGSALDYQLVEQENEQGFTRLELRIHPRLAIPDEGEVVAEVLEALQRSTPMADSARAVWQRAGTLQVKRAEPLWTARGKFLPLHLMGSQPARPMN